MSEYKFTKSFLLSCSLLVSFLLLFVACKKEYKAFPYHDIEQFQVNVDGQSNIDAVLKGDSIILYWPPFINMPDSISPRITLSERASILPASGQKVPFSDKTRYTVTAQDGSLKVYHLRRVNNQPLLNFESTRTLQRGGVMALSGKYFVPDTAKTRVYLLDKQNRSVRINTIVTLTASSFVARMPTAAVLDTGTYHIQMISGSRMKINGPFKILR
ncbi:hypothetical protein [Pedobacter gandavensis]|uniref:hypothetical protein n=1 Tax=Pedobacter gandavensis TaxID=2679963 RepID=UPI0029316532|nr:hypothetical protein [Pedobacter gandavensis]